MQRSLVKVNGCCHGVQAYLFTSHQKLINIHLVHNLLHYVLILLSMTICPHSLPALSLRKVVFFFLIDSKVHLLFATLSLGRLQEHFSRAARRQLLYVPHLHSVTIVWWQVMGLLRRKSNKANPLQSLAILSAVARHQQPSVTNTVHALSCWGRV